MPEPDNPKYTLWKGKLEKELAALQGEVVFIGHSLGGSVLLKYLSEETCPLSISGLFLIAAPYWDKDFKEYALPDNFVSRLPQISQVFLYHSRNDDIVPFAHLERYAQRFPQAISRALDGDQHTFNDGLPELVDDIKSV
jgi:predicted alpha/beta hydrolase family esterase